MPRPPVSHTAWLARKNRQSTLKSTPDAMGERFSELLQKILDLEQKMKTETGGIIKDLRKMENEGKKRQEEAFKRIEDLERGVIGGPIKPIITDKDVMMEGKEFSEAIRDLGLESNYLDDVAPPRANAKPKKSGKTKKDKKKKQTKKRQTKKRQTKKEKDK
jgi:hypothetical protein